MIAAFLIFLGTMLHGMNYNGHKAKDSTLKANLVMLRSAVETYQADCGGYPVDLTGLTTKPTQMYVNGVLTTMPADAWKGPYLNSQGGIGGGALPRNPYLPADDVDIAHHWTYDGAKGTLTFPAPVGKDSGGELYSNY
ncbi:MAG: type II secretion system protein GspG [bacterium]